MKLGKLQADRRFEHTTARIERTLSNAFAWDHVRSKVAATSRIYWDCQLMDGLGKRDAIVYPTAIGVLSALHSAISSHSHKPVLLYFGLG